MARRWSFGRGPALARPVPEPPARVRQALAGERRRGWTYLLVGVLLLAGAVVAMVVSYDRADELQRTGIRWPGRVTEIEPSQRRQMSIVVRFRYEGIWRSERVYLNDSSPDYRLDQLVEVVIDRDDPGRVTIVGEENESPRVSSAILVVVLAAGIALVFGVRFVRQARFDRRRLERPPPAGGWSAARTPPRSPEGVDPEVGGSRSA